MAQQDFNIGTVPNDKTGDNYRTAFTKAQDNFDEVFKDQQQVLYVSKVGIDSDSGLNRNEPKLTINAAISAAALLTPSESNQIRIEVVDAGNYSENINLPEWVSLSAWTASVDGRIDVADNTSLLLGRAKNTDDTQHVIRKTTGTVHADIRVGHITVDGTLQQGVRCTSGKIVLSCEFIQANVGVAIKAQTGTVIVFSIKTIFLTNGGVGLNGTTSGGDANKLIGSIQEASDDGTGVLFRTRVPGDVINIQGGTFNVDTLYDIGATGTLNMFANEVSGTEIADPTAVVKSTISGGGISGVTVTVLSVDDFPAPTANVITLEDGVVYVIAGHVDIGVNTISYGVASEIQGINTSISSISSTSTNPIIECTNQLLRLSFVILSNPNGDLFDFTGSTSAAFLISQVGAFSFLNIGTFHNTDVGIMNECLFDGFTNGILFTGTGVGSWSIMASIFSGFSGVALDFGTASIGTAGLTSNVFSGLGGSTSWSGLSSSANITVRASVDKNVFNGAGTALVGILPSDVKYTFTNNTNVPDTRNAADMFLIGGSETITTGSAGDWQEIGVPSGGGVSWSSDISDRFTVGTDGVLTYIGESDIEATLTGRATVEKSGGGSNVLEVRFAVNWNGTVSDGGLAKSRAQTQSADPTTVPIGALTLLSNGDNVRVIFSNTDGTSDIVASVASVEITG